MVAKTQRATSMKMRETIKLIYKMTEERKGCTEIIISDEELMRINPEKKPLTVETLRTFKGMETLSDEEAQEIIFSLETFCIILFEAVKAQTEIEEANINQQKIAA